MKCCKLIGILSKVGGLTGYISSSGNLTGEIMIGRSGIPYTGPYEVIPIFDDQILETNGKTMQDDVTVDAIPVSYTENLGGGFTVFIGGNVSYG